MSIPVSWFGSQTFAWKTALHVHTLRSDGEYSPEEMLAVYQKDGFDVVCMTDHRKSAPVSQWKSPMLLIPGMEFHPAAPRGILWHIVTYGLPEEVQGDPSILPVQQGIDNMVAFGAVCHVAHPAWSELRSSDIEQLKNISGVEIFNAGTEELGKEYSLQTMLELWQNKNFYPPLAVDDLHHKCRAGLGWTMVLSDKRDQTSILQALREGRVYASTGLDFTSFEWKDNILSAQFTPCSHAFLMMRECYAYHFPCLTRAEMNTKGVYSQKNSISVDLTKLPDEVYVQITLQDDAGHRAWSKPFYKKDGNLVF